jgi:hypothetical protein
MDLEKLGLYLNTLMVAGDAWILFQNRRLKDGVDKILATTAKRIIPTNLNNLLRCGRQGRTATPLYSLIDILRGSVDAYDLLSRPKRYVQPCSAPC